MNLAEADVPFALPEIQRCCELGRTAGDQLLHAAEQDDVRGLLCVALNAWRAWIRRAHPRFPARY
jgi:hypothetical protein